MAHGWTSFYAMIGTSAAGLIGLMFVVVTLTNSRGRPSTLRAIALYLTPTILHFGAVLAVSAVTVIPDITAPEAAAALAFVALAGLACCLRSAIGIVRVVNQPPHWSDFWLYACVPAVLYVALLAAALGVLTQAPWAPRLTALTLLVLLLLAVRNAWDTITWIAASSGES
jgi:hypothetical protein